MAAPFLQETCSLETLREEIVWSRDACEETASAEDQAKVFSKLEAEWWDIFRKQTELWDAQSRADARIHRADDLIDDFVDEVDQTLRALVRNGTDDPHYGLYFTVPKRELVRPVLGAELETVRGWLPLLEAEENPKLSGLAPRLQALLDRADAAVKFSREADAANARFREVGELAAFRAKVVEQRDKVHATLEKRRTDEPRLKLPREFARSVFRPARRTESEESRKARAAEKEAARKAAAELTQKKKEALDKLKAAKRELAALEAQGKK